MKLNYLRIQNLRSLADTDKIELRPLTLLVGTNSSGKSTFLRSLPLLRQSVETPTTGPILWYGRYVDFGSFAQAVRKNAETEEITFEFGLTLERNFDPDSPSMLYYRRYRVAFLENIDAKVCLTLGKGKKDGKTYAKAISIKLQDDEICVQADEDGNITGIHINDYDAVAECKLLHFVPSDNLLPILVLRPEAQPKAPQPGQRISPRILRWSGPFEQYLRTAFKPLFAAQTSLETILEVAHSIGIGSPQAQLKQLRRFSSTGSVYQKRIASLKQSESTYKNIRNALFGDILPRLLQEIDSALAAFFRPVRYIAPVRATAERYYRQQDLSVDEVDPQGANLAMFLQSLPWEEKQQFSEWCKAKLGFSVHARTEGAHISLLLKDVGTETEYNIADMGFGFSQILPVLAQIWSLTRGVRRRQTSPSVGPRYYREEFEPEAAGDIVAIEQPELHLHPKLQAKVADMFASAAALSKESKRPLTIVFETHSETIVNRIGHLVAHGKIASSDVQILLFEKMTADSDTKVKQATFNSDGVLQNWPHGFFLAASDDSDFAVQAEFTDRKL